ncbi:transmembrane protein KIAA1109 homolog tweek isoform X2 [Brevipalpus obovatus]|uniref:transmembrane protein KIAA1109 homolog tweek isoform X2 n=1 Tax=Brevipalpus obovatus TaxID=246614 RepID=UPI003D9F44F0
MDNFSSPFSVSTSTPIDVESTTVTPEKTRFELQFSLPNITIGSDKVPLDADFAWLLFLLFLSILWLAFTLYFWSRLFGIALTKLVNNIIIPRYLSPCMDRCEQPSFHASSFSLTCIAGKIMFRDIVWVTTDYSVRVQDGWIIIRWWQPFEPQDIRTSDFSHSDTRISMQLNGYELHIYNRSKMYSELEKTFGINPSHFCSRQESPQDDELKIIPDPGGGFASDERSSNKGSANMSMTKDQKMKQNEQLISAYLWRNFFPLTKIEILSGRFVFGNHLVPSTLLITFEEGHISYTSRPAVSPHDLFTHIAKAKAESFKVILAPSPKYAGLVEEPPRFMGEGFVVFQTNLIDLYYYQDEPGIESSEPEKIELPTGDIVQRFTSPAWGLDIKCGKGTHFGYGPWADRNRDYLYNFFYPPDFKIVKPDPRPPAGHLRQFETFYIRLSTLADAAIDVLFINKEKETKALHVNAGPGSYLEVSLPWSSSETGYQTHIIGQILHLDATTNLNFRSLAESETLEFKVDVQYPRIWNDHQMWQCTLTGCKSTVDLIFAHKIFFHDLIEDWAVKDRPDLMQFVPYTWKFNIILKDFELITLANEYNWIDCSSKLKNENAQLAICGDVFDMSFDLPFNEFLPHRTPIKIWIQGESLTAALHLPECNPNRDSIFMLDKYAKLCPPFFNSSSQESHFNTIKTCDLFSSDKKWRRCATRENGWLDCWTVPIVALSITYTYYPVPPKTHAPKPSEITTPEREELLLEPIRPKRISSIDPRTQAPVGFDPGSMEPDLVEIELEVGPSKICLYGALFRMLWNIKENYVGESQEFTDFNSNPSVAESLENKFKPQFSPFTKPFDARLYRPLAVTISVTLHDIQGHIMKSCDECSDSSDAPPCPYLYLERLTFEMDKRYSETKMQLLLSPLIMDAPEYTFARGKRVLTNSGHLIMDTLQFRGHAMFSGLDRPLDSETLEYAWLIEVHLGDITGKLSPSQLYQVIVGIEAFFVQMLQEDSSLQPPTPYQKCLHDIVQSLCPKTQESDNKMCPYSEDLKYRMVRVDLDRVQLYLAEKNSVIALELEHLRLCNCNLHSCHTSSGMTILIKETNLHHFMKTTSLSNFRNSKVQLSNHASDSSLDTTFYEVAKVNLGALFIDSVELFSVAEKFTVNQDTFLRQHDSALKRLWFLWPERSKEFDCKDKCGCVGGCAFFGNNSHGKTFFSCKKKEKSILIVPNGKEILWGESLLRPGEPVPGFQVNTIIIEEDESTDRYELAPLIDRNSLRLSSPLSPSFYHGSSNIVGDPSSQNISSLVPSQRTGRSLFFHRQLSSPAAQGFLQSRTDNLSPSYLNSSDRRTFTFKEPLPRDRSHSETDELELTRDRFSESELNTNDSKKSSESQPPEIPKTMTSSLKTSMSYQTPTENQYVTANESFSRSLTNANDVFVSATSNDPVPHVLSDDTFKSVQSISGSTNAAPNLDQASLSHDALNKSLMSIQSTYSAPPSSGKAHSRKNTNKDENEEDNRSISSSSFLSAVSSQEENEDINAMVDLRNQMEKPIIESPLLMSSYMNYLTKFKSDNYRPHSTAHVALDLRGRRKAIPRFNLSSSHGLSLIKLVEKKPMNHSTSQNERLNPKDTPNVREDSFIPGSVFQKIDASTSSDSAHDGEENKQDQTSSDPNNRQKLQKEFSKTVDFRSEKLTILIRFDGEICVRLSPLSLDGLKTLFSGLADTFAAIHPSTVINHLNAKCYGKVSRKNQLKKSRTLEYGQLKHKVWKSTLERENLVKQIGASKNKLGDAFQDVKSQLKNSSGDSTITVNQCEENRKSEFQAFLQISNINFVVLQASLVEEFITFSALDDTKDLTCVSMLSISLSRINFDSYSSSQERRSLHTIISNNIRSQPTSAFAQFAQSDIVSRLLFRKPKKEIAEVEPVTIETHELIEEEMVGCGGIENLHVQLTRLKNNCNILNEAILTVVPHSHSKVNFHLEKNPISETLRSNHITRRRSSGTNRVLKRQDGLEGGDSESISIDSKLDNSDSDGTSSFGFIMFECGLEGITLKAIKKREMSEVEGNKNGGSENEDQEKRDKKNRKEKEKKEASSFVGEINVVWFNFAAPPKTPNTRKIDFTRLDWHLLSTATPSINAWMSVGDRFIVAFKEITSLYEQRVASTVSYLMISALEIDGIHIPPQSKCYVRKMTPYSKALQEDPSCQLMNVLRRFLLRHVSLKDIESNLRAGIIPPLPVLKRGVVAASRQWKNALYMPLLVEQNIKKNRGQRDTSSIYQSGIPLRFLLENSGIYQSLKKGRESMQVKNILKSAESKVPDEKTNLLFEEDISESRANEVTENNISEIPRDRRSSQPEIVITCSVQNPANEESMLTSAKRKISTLPNIFTRSSRGSLAYPLLTYPLESLGSGVNKAYEFLFSQNSHQSSANRNKREGSQMSLKSLSTSTSSDDPPVVSESILNSKPSDSASYHEENLYIWMSRQQDYMEAKNLYNNAPRRQSATSPRNIDLEQARQDTLGSAYSNDEETLPTDTILDIPPGFVFIPAGVQMNNVLTIFQPLFRSLGIENINEEGEPCISFDQLGPKITLSTLIKMLKVNIVESELGDLPGSSRCRSPIHMAQSSTSQQHSKNNLLRPDLPSSPFKSDDRSEAPAFFCDQLALNLDLRKVRDSKSPESSETNRDQPDNIKEEEEEQEENDEKVPILFVGPDGGIDEITTMINFNVDVHHIVQRVNLPLLRLLHQVASMYENIKETRSELRANRVSSIRNNDIEKAKLPIVSPTDIDYSNVGQVSTTPSLSSFPLIEKKDLETPAKETVINIPMSNDESIEMASIRTEGQIASGERESEVVLRPKCWKTMFYLLDLYETTPETKTVAERAEKTASINQSNLETRINIDDEDDNRNRGKGGYEPLRDNFSDGDDQSTPTTVGRKVSFEAGTGSATAQRKSMMNIVSSDKLKNFTQALIHRELTPLVVFGVTRIEKVNLSAMLGGLKLDGELNSFHVSLTHKSKIRGAALQFKKWKESSLTGHLGQSNFSLLEEVPPSIALSTNQQMVVKMTIGKSQTLISSQNKKGKDANSVLLTIGAIFIDIPQHPVALHGMMTRSSKQLSTTLQELRSSRQPSRSSHQPNELDLMTQSFATNNFGMNNLGQNPTLSPSVENQFARGLFNITQSSTRDEAQKLIKPIVFQFSIVFDSFTIGASLLPSLKAQYQIGQITSSGIMGTEAKFIVDVREHTLSFNTNLSITDSNLPSSANVSMPPIHVSAEYMDDKPGKRGKNSSNQRPESFAEGIVLRKGSYLNAIADIGSFEHSLTTDLLNHLLLVQKVFMREVNEVVQKMSGHENKMMDADISDFEKSADKSLSIPPPSKGNYLLFTLNLRMKGVQITATTPTNSAVRLETGSMELQLSNRVQNMSSNFRGPHELSLKLFIKLQVDLNVALGQLIRNPLFEEADPEFQQLAYFKTRIMLRNALQDEMIPSSSAAEGKEALLITLNRPLVYIQPLALDKAVLVWLNYKNAYEYWNEQRGNLNTEVLYATQQVFDKMPQISQMGSPTLGTLFLQLTIDDLGICLPISYSPSFPTPGVCSKSYDAELRSALVVTLESTRISACSCGSLVSKGRFTGLCFRFVEDFETSLDDWKPDANSIVMNKCKVSEGTYEICSKTITHIASHLGSDAKWLLNVSWKMDGFDIHVDTSIGKQFSALFKTLTAIAGDENEKDSFDYSSVVDDVKILETPGEQPNESENSTSKLENEAQKVDLRRSSLFKDNLLDTRKRSRLIEKELNEQAKIINDLRQLGASQSTIEQEIKRLHELESAVFNDFKRDVIKKLRRQSMKRSFREKMKFNENKLDTPIDEDRPQDFDTQSSQNRTNHRNIFTHPIGQPRSASLQSAEISNNPESKEQEMRSLDSSGAQSKLSHQIQDPFIDFELDVKVFFKSGQCVFHTRDPNAEREVENSKKNESLKEKSFTGNPDELSPPSNVIPRHGALRSSITNNKSTNLTKTSISHSKLRYQAPNNVAPNLQTEFTSFSIPGLDIKVHYNSKTVFTSPSQLNPSESNRSPSEYKEAETIMGGQSGILAKRIGTKKASCYAWMTLHRIPKETLITPQILDFMEQALEPIPIPLQSSTKPNNPIPGIISADTDGRPDLITSAPAQYAVYGSFPVDVIVYLHMQPSILRFSCLPVSRVECLLQLPSVDLVISSKRSQDELNFSPSQPYSPKLSVLGYNRSSDFKHTHRRSASDYRYPQHQTETAIGGLSMTGCLADFSLYIFHPYGGQHSSAPKKEIDPSKFDRKDSLSLQVEFVKVNISRSRRLVLTIEQTPSSRSMQSSPHTSPEKSLNQKVMIKFSALCDIGSASFKYDMRRLTEILAFPKAWYRKAIWKRMFLGDQNIGRQNVFSEHSDFRDFGLSSSSSSESIDEDVLTSRNKIISSGNANQRSILNQHSKTSDENKPPWFHLEDLKTVPMTADKLREKNFHASFSSGETFQQQRQIMNAPWETNILFGVNLCKLNVHMNMGNVMGNTSWLTRGFRSEGGIRIDSSGLRDITVTLALDGSSLDAKGGIVGGIFEINHIQTRVGVMEKPGTKPDHVLTLQLDALEKRLDYMGTSILMLRVSDLDLTLRDDWIVDPCNTTSSSARIYINGNLSWDQLQLLMSKSTTPDIIKISKKMEEFFTQQFNSSKRVFSTLQPAQSTTGKTVHRHSFRDGRERGSIGGRGKPSTPISSSSTGALPESSGGSEGSGSSFGGMSAPIIIDARHHRHWQKVLRLASGASLSTLSSPLPERGTSLGGKFELNGKNISLACFNGINFRSKSWALFSLRQPSISFYSEAQEVIDTENLPSDTHIIQDFSFSLGRTRHEMDEKPFSADRFYAQHANMATVCRMSRSFTYPAQFKTMHEWFQYTFADSELDEISRFPVIEFERSGDGFGSAASSVPNKRISMNPKSQEHHHNKEVIFALPSLQMNLKTEHLQNAMPPTLNDLMPKVDCTFVTDFDDHIFVAVDAEAYFFLHELIQSYIKEKQTDIGKYASSNPDTLSKTEPDNPEVTQLRPTAAKSVSSTSDQESNQLASYERDWREFNCQTWHLEPTVRLVTWGGKSIEPYGVDYILQRLGFTQARTTIPKWIQRGAMDPLDKVLSAIMYQIISAARNEPTSSSSSHRNP